MNKDMLTAALAGGLIIGMTSVLPGVDLGQCVFCAWIWIGGFASVLVYKRLSGRPCKAATGAWLGLASGVFGVVFFALFIKLAQWTGILNYAESFHTWLLSVDIDKLMKEAPASPFIRAELEALLNSNPEEAFSSFFIRMLVLFSLVAPVTGLLSGLAASVLFENGEGHLQDEQSLE